MYSVLCGDCEVFSSGFFALVLGLFLLGNDDVRRYHVRTIVDLPEEQIRKLTLLCRRERISRAEAIRRAVPDISVCPLPAILAHFLARPDLAAIFPARLLPCVANGAGVVDACWTATFCSIF